ncbi:MAG: hypothetical protein ACLP01_19375 [Solirubrobacteraceae bacterium]
MPGPDGLDADYSGIAKPSFTYTQGSPDSTYTFTVFAVGSNGAKSGPSNTNVVTTLPQPAPAAPTISPVATSPSRVSVVIGGDGDAVRYGLFLDGSPVPAPQLVFGAPGYQTTFGEMAYTVVGLTPGTKA